MNRVILLLSQFNTFEYCSFLGCSLSSLWENGSKQERGILLFDGEVRQAMKHFRLNKAVFGYALFLSASVAGVWGGVFPFIPLEFQSKHLLGWFFVMQSVSFCLGLAVIALCFFFAPRLKSLFFVTPVGLIYSIGWVSLIAALYVPSMQVVFFATGGFMLGLGTAGFYSLWQQVFSSQEGDVGNRNLMVGVVYAAAIYLLLYLVPTAVTELIILLVFVPLICLMLVLCQRDTDWEQSMFIDDPMAHLPVYSNLVRQYWRSTLSFGAIGFCCGLVRAFALGDIEVGNIVNIVSMSSSAVAAIAILGIWARKNIRISPSVGFVELFPIAITLFMILALAGPNFAPLCAGIFYALYSLCLILLMIQCAQISRDYGVHPILAFTVFAGAIFLLQDLGFGIGMAVEAYDPFTIESTAAIALMAMYVLSAMLLIGVRGFLAVFRRESSEPCQIELIAVGASGVVVDSTGRHRSASQSSSPAEDALRGDRDSMSEDGEKDFDRQGIRDKVSKQCMALQEAYRLTARETEVLEYLVRGHTVPSIANKLIVSENTVRAHQKHIYSKLSVHKKSELLEML